MPIDPRHLIGVQNKPPFIRNICILAHVDHGKTSLSDTLLASNGIISQSMQGQIRYLDSRPDEQLRGITMESSAISLYFKMARRPENEDEKPVVHDYLVNLIDSPGHIDFSSEVSTASRLCDSAVILVDAVEGVSSQTVTVLKQSWDEQLKPILVVNKMDRLVVELKMSPLEAYLHVSKLVEQVNAVLGSFFSGRRMAQASDSSDSTQSTEEESDEGLYFDPVKNNVVFCSAIDGWGFSVGQFAGILERRLGMNRDKLEKVLWGDFYFDTKLKKVMKGAASKQKKPMFAQFVLENVWAVYNAVFEQDTEKLEKIITGLQLKVPPNTVKSRDTKHQLSVIFNQWIPVSRSILATVVNILPSPDIAQANRSTQILDKTPSHEFIDSKIRSSMLSCDATGPVVGFVSKVTQVPKGELPLDIVTDKISELRIRSERTRKDASRSLEPTTANRDVDTVEPMDSQLVVDDAAVSEDEVLIGFTRIFSGTVTRGMKLDILGPRYNPEEDIRPDMIERANPTLDEFQISEAAVRNSVTVEGLYLLMGRDLIPVDKAYPGNIIGVTGLDGKIIKTGTLVSPGARGPNFASTNTVAAPIMRVALEPVRPTQIPELEHGLQLLNISDPSVEVSISEQGEYILGTAGELHLERCLKDLRDRFAKVEIEASNPVVPYQETYLAEGEWVPPEDDPEQERGHVELTVSGFRVALEIVPLPEQVASFLAQEDTDEILIQGLYGEVRKGLEGSFGAHSSRSEHWMSGIIDKLVAFGPRNAHANLLIDDTPTKALKRRVYGESSRGLFDEGLISGFNVAVSKGPLLAEPVHGMACIVRAIEDTRASAEGKASMASRRIISATRELIREGMQHWSPRLMLAMYKCDIQASTEVLGKVYGVITRRRGKVITEDLKEGTPFFTVTATVPVIESFGFPDEIRKRTSGAANPQLVFDGFAILDEDPYWVPTTEDQLEHYGETSDHTNIALGYVQSVRRQKGLRTNEKLVNVAERQRTLKK